MAYGGQECLEKVKDSKPDLIVLDVMMPGMNGWQVCETLKGSEDTAGVPIIMLTAVASQVRTTKYSHLDGMETQADDYIPKPVNLTTLLERIQRILK